MQQEDSFNIIGKWSNKTTMEKHFLGDNYSILIGAAKVLGKSFTMSIAEVDEDNGFELAKRKTRKSNNSNNSELK